MKIKKGYNDKETIIGIQARPENRSAELWIEQHGLSEKETLSYMSLEELMDLKDEIDEALKLILKLK